jgi:hypothetical protein
MPSSGLTIELALLISYMQIAKVQPTSASMHPLPPRTQGIAATKHHRLIRNAYTYT